MIRILQLGISILLFLASCHGQPSVYFSEIKPLNVRDYNNSFSEYCRMDSTQNFEINAVVSSFFGDYKNAIAFATKDAISDNDMEAGVQIENSEIIPMKQHLERILNESSSSDEERSSAKKMLRILSLIQSDVNEVFKDKVKHNAKDFIVDKAKDYHFLLINEAHYCSQNRAFTRSLLKPLWEQGFRYLALEALWYEDTSLKQRGYPVMNTGYYIKDAVFGNMIREALKMGYKLITYERTADYDGTLRDRDQALNIYQNTWQKDSVGKVLIHAGYSHIAETENSTYIPMGAQLKSIANQEILTIDQERMKELTDDDQLHPYYKYAINHIKFKQPIVFDGKNGQSLVDPINSLAGIDIQVYHPKTQYIDDRPFWLLTENEKTYELPKDFEGYNGLLLQAVPVNENDHAVPVDQFVISPERKTLVLPPGKYELRLTNCEGTLVGKSSLRIYL